MTWSQSPMMGDLVGFGVPLVLGLIVMALLPWIGAQMRRIDERTPFPHLAASLRDLRAGPSSHDDEADGSGSGGGIVGPEETSVYGEPALARAAAPID